MLSSEFKRHIKTPEFKEALAKYEDGLESGNSVFLDAEELLDIAEYYHMMGDIEAAENAATYCLDLYPDNPFALVFLARGAILAGNIELARRYSDCIESEEELDVAYLRAELMMTDKRFDDADEYLSQYYDRKKELQSEDVNLMPVDIALIFCDYECWDKAELWLNLLPEGEQAENVDAIEAWARIFTGRQEFSKAIDKWNAFIDYDAFSDYAWSHLAHCQYQSGLCHEALDSAIYVITLNPEIPEGYLTAGNASFAIGLSKDAIMYYEKFIELFPGDPQGELLLASCLFSLERNEEALEHADKAIAYLDNFDIDQVPDFIIHEIFRQAAFINAALGKLNEAFLHLDKLLFYGLSEENVLLLRAAILLEANKPEEAFDIYNGLMQSGNPDPDTYMQIGMMLVDSNYIEMGKKVLMTVMAVLKASGTETEIGHDRLAYAALLDHDYPLFLVELEKSVRYLPIETVTVFSPYFPENLPIDKYVEYARENEIKV